MTLGPLWLSVQPDGWAAINEHGELVGEGRSAFDALQATYGESRDVFCPDGVTLLRLLAAVPSAKAAPDSTIVREVDGGLGVDCGGFAYTHGARYWNGGMLFPEPVASYCRRAGWEVPCGDPVQEVSAFMDAHLAQQALVETITGVAPSRTLASTAAKAALPARWRHGGLYFGASIAYANVRKAYYGGRIECFVPGWEGEAVEYDIRSAYGWALSQPIPDWQVYETRPILKREPGWLDVTVELHGAVGPLPVRDALKPRVLHYPRTGVVRGWWPKLDLEREGVRVLQVHQQIAGRPSDDLRGPVNAWLERREATTSVAEKATIRGLAVGLAGKLAQKPLSWALWHNQEGCAPSGSHQLMGTDWWVYPCVPVRAPMTLPTTASYVTSMVRAKVWPTIRDGVALYTHTDSVHLPAEGALAGRGPACGDKAGDWSIKAEGQACYKGPNRYTIGNKRVG